MKRELIMFAIAVFSTLCLIGIYGDWDEIARMLSS